MTLTSLLLPLLKVTVLIAVAQLCLMAMGRATAAMRHFICAAALAGCLLIPFLPAISDASISVPAPFLAHFSISATGASSSTWPIVPMLVVAWSVGTGLILARTLLGYIALARLLRGASGAGTASNIPIVAVGVKVPFVAGLRRPTIALPLDWPAHFREAAIRHELAHVKRRDLWTEVFTRITCAIYWFHPLVWLMAARLRVEREAACDDAVLSSGFDAPCYAQALVAAARGVTGHPVPDCAMAAQTTLRERTARLLDSTLPRLSTRSSLVHAGICCAVVLGGIGLINPAASAPLASKAQPAAQARTQPSIRWKIQPAYTEQAKAEKITGPVEVRLLVGADGVPRDVTVARGLDPGLDQQAVNALRKWRFNPGTLNGKPVEVPATIVVNFNLK